MSGWIKLHRAFLNWEWFGKPNMSQFFIYCLLQANYEDTRWQGRIIPRGSFIASLSDMSAATGLTTREIRTCLKKLEKSGEIAAKTTNQNHLITICNYESYQSNESPERQTSDKRATSPILKNIII